MLILIGNGKTETSDYQEINELDFNEILRTYRGLSTTKKNFTN